MRHTRLGTLIIVVMVCLATGLAAAQGEAARTDIVISEGWEFRQVAPPNSDGGVWRPAKVPGDVHLDLLRNKLIPDPFYRDNEAKLQWIEVASWEYRTTINITPETLKKRNLELVFDGLDAYAEVFLNGSQVLVANNMFRIWRVNVKPVLHSGANQLRVVFPSPDTAAGQAASADPWRMKTHVEEKTYVRKAAYEYGWDWGPTFVTSGIWRPVHLEAWDEARISNLHIRQLDVTAAVAHLNGEVEVTATENATAEVSIRYSQGGKPGASTRSVSLHVGVNHIDLPLEIAKPDLWYPAGYGAQPLYTFTAEVKAQGQMEDHRAVSTGLRSVVLRRDLDKWGRSFEFVVNGIPVFGKGADVIPFDSFPNRVTEENYRRILQSAKDANMNMLRLWGGGYYESEEFYKLCDELGIMLWQDFMFGNDWQPGLYSWKLNVAAEIEDQVKRLRDHPSIVIWSGNNETEEAIFWKDRQQLPADVRIQMWQDYVSTFSGVIPSVVERLDPLRPYWPSSPSADYEETSPTFQTGDAHIWDVWHGRVPFSTYEQHHARFVTEYGFQSFPEMKTIEAFTSPEDRTGIFTPVMLAHQKNNEGNSLIQDYLLKDYPAPKDFASFLYVSQVLQAEGIKIGAEHLRRSRPETMGSIFWQLNDCWPVASWSSIDYYGRWKALQYYARRFYAPVLVSPHVEDGILKAYIVSDKVQPVSGQLRVRIVDFDGKVVKEALQPVNVPALSSQVYWQRPLADLGGVDSIDSTSVFVMAELVVDGKSISRNLIYLVPTKQVILPEAHISTELTQAADGYHLKLSSPVLARSVYVTFGALSPELSDNYFDLLPGEAAVVLVKSRETLDRLKANLHVVSLADAFKVANASK
ncbi:MAG: glycoside hydrolase family 2 TIM barrel-domain containing protein [Acidobacteriota bacterium]|nr:glycoside hydrolase family 2 TIM barrel-domain containing protein [Acidobacteriota bacterium]